VPHESYRTPKSPHEVCPLLVGVAIPSVRLTAVDGAEFDLTASIERTPAALVFYRGGW
jgi:hypothetical protein